MPTMSPASSDIGSLRLETSTGNGQTRSVRIIKSRIFNYACVDHYVSLLT